ncbi:TfoX/Sxy family DNA transformation protein [Deinococcus peraridilitoris]|uniref:TfoX/Sxy family DNA transformation protein n=1 Tax=Deinococcus peraridilitoris TaxID=432329 RepID=UPI003CCC0EAD
MGDLREAGAVEAFVRYRIVGEQPSLNLLWALVAGLRGAHWASLGWMKRSA